MHWFLLLQKAMLVHTNNVSYAFIGVLLYYAI